MQQMLGNQIEFKVCLAPRPWGLIIVAYIVACELSMS